MGCRQRARAGATTMSRCGRGFQRSASMAT
jgi:hypothetical protein